MINCELILEVDNVTEKTETNYYYNTDIIIIKTNLLYNIYKLIPRVFKDPFTSNIKHMTLITINNRCNMSYRFITNSQMIMIERRVNIIFAKNPLLIKTLNMCKNHPSIRKYCHIPFFN